MVTNIYTWSAVPHKSNLIGLEDLIRLSAIHWYDAELFYRLVDLRFIFCGYCEYCLFVEVLEAPSTCWSVTSYTMPISSIGNSPLVFCILPSISAVCCLGEILQIFRSPFHISCLLSGWRIISLTLLVQVHACPPQIKTRLDDIVKIWMRNDTCVCWL